MKKVDLLRNEIFTIKGVYGESYVFDGNSLFIDYNRKATVLKSLRTEQGARDWIRLMGLGNAEIVSKSVLKAFDGDVFKKNKEGDDSPLDDDDSDIELPFHVITTEQMSPFDDDGDEPLQDADDLMDDEREEQEMTMSQAAQVFHDAQALHDMIKDREHLEPWMQKKLTKVADYLSAIKENLEHEGGDLPDDDDDMMKSNGSSMTMMSESSEIEDEEDDEEENKPPFMKSSVKSSSEDEEGEEGEEEEEEGENPAGKIFKSLHAARQWNRFENPDPSRYYVDIMREKDVRKGFSKSTGLNAKYVVRDMKDKEDKDTKKGAYGNKVIKKSYDEETSTPEKGKESTSSSRPANDGAPIPTAPAAKIEDYTSNEKVEGVDSSATAEGKKTEPKATKQEDMPAEKEAKIEVPVKKVSAIDAGTVKSRSVKTSAKRR